MIILGLVAAARAQVTYTVISSADAFLATGAPGNPEVSDLTGVNFGAAGTLVVAPASSVKGEFQSVIRFDISGATNLFNAAYGTNWVIDGISLEFASNYGTGGVQPNNPIFDVIHGGKFVIEWLADNTWVEGTGTPNFPTADGVTYDSLPDLLSSGHEALCTNIYVPPGDNAPVTWTLPVIGSLSNNVVSGGEVSFRLYAADNQVNYLFNSYKYGHGNEPKIHITVSPLLRILSGTFSNGLFHLVGLGGTNAPCQIQANSDLTTTHWQTLGTVTADDAGFVRFDDLTASNHARRFYRLSR